MSVQVHELVKTYGQQHAVDHVSFDVPKGEILGFLGPNGAGKSTTMKIITGYLSASSGEVLVNDIPVSQDSLAVRRMIGYLPEHNPLYLEMYVREYLAFAGRLYGLKGKKLRQQVEAMIELCGLQREQHKKIGALSKGYRQRVGLAQALIHDPSVLILDEPTTGLDPNQIVEIRQVIRSISEEKTVIFSTHIMQEVQALCDRALIINRGKMVAYDTVESLLSAQDEQQVIHAEFSAPIDNALLSALPGIVRVEEKAPLRYAIHCEGQQDCRAEVFHFAVSQQVALLGMQQEQSSLENIFQQLTTGQKQREGEQA